LRSIAQTSEDDEELQDRMKDLMMEQLNPQTERYLENSVFIEHGINEMAK
jgi:hypothetical protein